MTLPIPIPTAHLPNSEVKVRWQLFVVAWRVKTSNDQTLHCTICSTSFPVLVFLASKLLITNFIHNFFGIKLFNKTLKFSFYIVIDWFDRTLFDVTNILCKSITMQSLSPNRLTQLVIRLNIFCEYVVLNLRFLLCVLNLQVKHAL